tara:strand:- start:35 stop:430 length:396 start_codon:yes stop_codon:yes gene_type:complete
MKILIIEAISDKIFLVIIKNKNIYTSRYKNSKSNFDKLTVLIRRLLNKCNISLSQLSEIYVNRGPGSFAGTRSSISTVQGLHLAKKIDYFCYSYTDFEDVEDKKKIKWLELPKLCRKYKIKKNLIKPLYLS